jgi:hypothetical protein
MDEGELQINHRMPYEVGGDGESLVGGDGLFLKNSE